MEIAVNEARLVALKCPGCGAPLQLGGRVDTFACSYCGSNVQVERSGGIVSLSLLGDALKEVQRGTDRTAAELAIRRIGEELVVLERESERHEADYATAWHQWKLNVHRVQNEDPFAIFLVLNGVVMVSAGTMFYVVAESLFKTLAPARAALRLGSGMGLPNGLLFVIGLLVVATMAVATTFSLQWWAKDKLRRVAEAQAGRVMALTEPDKLRAECRAQIEAARARLQRHRELVDS